VSRRLCAIKTHSFDERKGSRAAKAVIQDAEHLELSERDSLRVVAALENPPKPNAKLLAAAKSPPQRK
jgi:uncharacterized protein (DUF1778 family)